MSTVIRLKDVSFAYDNKLILENINLEVEEKDFIAVIGPNGGGKTTLLRLIMGFIKPVKGKICLFGQPARKTRRHVGYVPQHGIFDQSFPISALEVVLTGLLHSRSFFPRYSIEERNRALEVMQTLEVNKLAEIPYGRLSGGQKQRILIARALVSKPRLLILDEPTASVDSRIERDVYELLQRLNQTITIIIVSHDLGFVSSYVKKVVCLNRQLAIHDVKEISSQLITDLYPSPMKMLEHQCSL